MDDVHDGAEGRGADVAGAAADRGTAGRSTMRGNLERVDTLAQAENWKRKRRWHSERGKFASVTNG